VLGRPFFVATFLITAVAANGAGVRAAAVDANRERERAKTFGGRSKKSLRLRWIHGRRRPRRRRGRRQAGGEASSFAELRTFLRRSLFPLLCPSSRRPKGKLRDPS